ncbi:hypothetical protein F751_3898 [Auxenochlorella protothecoides]|uniref:Uncharacterized protein n=1 Tax=Auxenochlorella protothecoides TaxID=3075 RepID=A0A087SD78_AUXPR|nr:hypothetical protein F751_3898 [Auxenochlorella protothecoides]KFM23682.1 hypothetical protein F751_3898 [Auxenochlorella protothecoides]
MWKIWWLCPTMSNAPGHQRSGTRAAYSAAPACARLVSGGGFRGVWGRFGCAAL